MSEPQAPIAPSPGSTVIAVFRAIGRELVRPRRFATPGRPGPHRNHRARALSPARRRRNRQRGVVLFTVTIAIAIILVISNEFGTSTNGDLMAAANYRDQMRSHFLARSAQNLSELVIRVQQRIDNVKQLRDAGIRITDFADQVLLAFCGNSEEVQAAIGLSSSDTKGLGADVGTCGIVGQITTEDDKLNLNCAKNNAVYPTLKTVLDGLLYSSAYDPVFEEADADNFRRDRATQVAAILDYVDPDNQHLHDFGTTEDYGYENLKDPYKPKNNLIDTVGELRLVRGVDDRFWTLFGSSFTAYGTCKINLSALTNPQLIVGLLIVAVSDKDKTNPILQDPVRLYALANLIAKAPQLGVTFTKVDDFVSFVKDPAAQVGSLAGETGTLAGSAAKNAVTGGGLASLTGGVKLGLELDPKKLATSASTGPRRTYHVEAWGEIERKQKMADGSPVFPPIRTTITGVWDTKVVPQNVRKPPMPKGAWVYLRED
jgi:general secretion pathway protein K